jgi:hypothetical protein
MPLRCCGDGRPTYVRAAGLADDRVPPAGREPPGRYLGSFLGARRADRGAGRRGGAPGTRWGLVGFGEAGRVIGGALADSGADLAVHDRLLPGPRPRAGRGGPRGGVAAVADLTELADRDVVLSVVTSATVLAAAEGFAAAARDGCSTST